jgi:hypothetical protein
LAKADFIFSIYQAQLLAYFLEGWYILIFLWGSNRARKFVLSSPSLAWESEAVLPMQRCWVPLYS